MVLVTLFLGAFTGQALAAWQARQLYQGDTLHGQPSGKDWSPSHGQLSGQVLRENGERRTIAEANYHRWNQKAIDWMKAQWWGTPSITFHVFDHTGDSCTQWKSMDWSWTNLPGASRYRPLRRCGDNEIRVQADRHQLVANTDYVAQVRFFDTSANMNARAKIVVDTYWDGNENYHQHYCIPTNQDVAGDRNTCQ
jgi:hypothetical protein